MKTWLFLTGALFASALLTSCSTAPANSSSSAPLPTVRRVDLKKYAGTWHEVSRLPNFYQKSCLRSVAEYTALPDGTVGVKNTCFKAKGRISDVEGVATPVPGSGNARLQVRFSGPASLAPVPAEGNYWIIALDPQYRWAMVGTPDRKSLWMLSRQPELPFETYRDLKQKAQSLGFPTAQLLPENAAPPGLAGQAAPGTPAS